jgi:hypothetical protein
MTNKPVLALIPALLLTSLLTGCAVLSAPVGSNPFKGQPVMAQGATVSPQPTATATQTPADTSTALPTPDYSAAYPAQTQAAAMSGMADSAQRIARAKATEVAAGLRLLDITATSAAQLLLPGTPTAIARATLQAEQTAQARAEMEAAYIAVERARILAEIERQANAEKTRQNMTQAAWIGGGVFVGAIILVIVVAVVSRLNYAAQIRMWRETAGEAADNLLDNLAEPPGFVPVAENRYHTANVPVSDKKFAAWAEAMLAGETAGINKWEGESSPFGRAEYKALLEWAEERGYIAIDGGSKILSETGRAFCAEWLKRRAPVKSETQEERENHDNESE